MSMTIRTCRSEKMMVVLNFAADEFILTLEVKRGRHFLLKKSPINGRSLIFCVC